MHSPSHKLSARAACVLELIAEGYAYDQILHHYPDLSYKDIFAAADEAIALLCATEPNREDPPKSQLSPWPDRLARIKAKYSRAYQAWTPEEEARLKARFEQTGSVREIAHEFSRQPSALRSRLVRLGVIQEQAD